MCSGPSVRNYNYYSAPPLVGGYGGYGYGGYGGGLSIFPASPIFFGGGGFFNILIFMVCQCFWKATFCRTLIRVWRHYFTSAYYADNSKHISV